MKIQTKYLTKFKNDNIFVDIYTDLYEESIYGFILDFNENFLLFEKFSDTGSRDGISIFRLEDITRLKWGGNDNKSVLNFALKEPRITNIENLNIKSIPEILNSVQQEFGHVTVFIQNVDNDMCIIGELEELDNETVVVHEFGTMATLDRKRIMFSIEEITRIDAGGEYENKLTSLFNKKN